jgi:threonine/homoserine/homoserine lactone efflux protein
LFEYLQIFWIAFVLGLSGAMSPGPLLAYTVHSAARRGWTVGALVVVGHGIVESTLVALIFVGAATFLTNPATLRIVGGVGAILLALMGAMMLLDAKKLSFSRIREGTGHVSRIDHPILGGVAMTAVNPMFPLWWAALGVSMVTTYGTNVTNLAVFYAGHITSDLLWYVTVSTIVGQGRSFISDRVYRFFIAGCALFLVCFAVKFGYAALTGASAAIAPPQLS